MVSVTKESTSKWKCNALAHEHRKLVVHALLVLLNEFERLGVVSPGLVGERGVRSQRAVRVRRALVGSLSLAGGAVAWLDKQVRHVVQHFALLRVDRVLPVLQRGAREVSIRG